MYAEFCYCSELVEPGISLTIVVPEEVPSDDHNSNPLVPSFAANMRELPNSANIRGSLPEFVAVLMSFTITVPEAVPSLFRFDSI